MIFYTLEILSQPKIEFACSILESMTPESRNIIDHRRGMIEFCVNNGFDMRVDYGARTRVRHNGEVGVYFPDEKYTLSPLIESPTEAQLNSVSVFIEKMRLEKKSAATEADAARIADDLKPGTIILPEAIALPRDDAEVFMSTSAPSSAPVSNKPPRDN